MKLFTTLAAVVTLLALFVSAALAAEQYPEFIANHGVAMSRLNHGKVITYDPVAAFHDQIVVADCTRHQTEYRGVTWCFASATNLKEFVAQETVAKRALRKKFLPMFGGRCSYGTSNGNLAARGDPRTALRVRFGERPQDERVFLNGSFNARAKFFGRAEWRIGQALSHWWTAQHLGLLVPNGRHLAQKG